MKKMKKTKNRKSLILGIIIGILLAFLLSFIYVLFDLRNNPSYSADLDYYKQSMIDFCELAEKEYQLIEAYDALLQSDSNLTAVSEVFEDGCEYWLLDIDGGQIPSQG
jgi:hypothetical protein